MCRCVFAEHRAQLDRIGAILVERETIEREEFEALLAGTPADEVFAEKDQKARKRAEAESTDRRAPRPRTPRVGPPLPADGTV